MTKQEIKDKLLVQVFNMEAILNYREINGWRKEELDDIYEELRELYNDIR